MCLKRTEACHIRGAFELSFQVPLCAELMAKISPNGNPAPGGGDAPFHFRPCLLDSLCTPLPVWYVEVGEDMRVTGRLYYIFHHFKTGFKWIEC